MNETTFDGKKNVIGKTLAALRRKNRLSQEQLAARVQVMGVNLNQQLISRIERNERYVTDFELACFCRALRVTPQELLAAFDEEYPE